MSSTSMPGTPPNASEVSGSDSHALMKVGGQLAPPSTLGWPHAEPMRPEILTAKPSPAQLMHALRRRWWLAVGIGVLVSAAFAGMAWMLVPINYEASALLHVAEKEKNIIGSQKPDDYINYKRGQTTIIKDSFVLSAALLDPDISSLKTIQEHKEDPVGWLADQLMIDYPGDSSYMRIAMRGEYPADLPRIVNAVKKAYMQEGVNREQLEHIRERDLLQASLEANQRRITDMLNAINATTRRLGTTSTDAADMKKRYEIGQLEDLLGQRAQILAFIRDLNMNIALAEKSEKTGAATMTDSLVEMELERNPQVQRAQEDLSRIKDVVYDESMRAADPNAPSVRHLRRRAAALEDSLDELKSELRPQIADQIKAAGRGGEGQLAMAKLKLEELKTSYKKSEEELKTLMESVGKTDKFNTDLVAQQRELDALQRITDQMDQQLKEWEVNKTVPQRVTEVREATMPKGNTAVKKYTTVGFAGAFGFCVVLFCVAFVEFQARRLNSRRDVSEGLGLRVLGDLPSFSGRAWRRGSTRGAVQAALAESIDSIRTRIIHAASSSPVRVVMITSADPREGKTTVASQLAGSLARAGRKTLFIDGDLRSPAAHRVFELPQEPGLCEMLRGEVEREAVLQPTRAANLWMVPAGRCDSRSVQALSGTSLSESIAAFLKQYDYIVIDAGPVLAVADPLLLGQHVDVAILSVLRDVSRVPKVYEAADRLRSVGINLMGVVVNGVSDGAPRHGYEVQLAESA